MYALRFSRFLTATSVCRGKEFETFPESDDEGGKLASFLKLNHSIASSLIRITLSGPPPQHKTLVCVHHEKLKCNRILVVVLTKNGLLFFFTKVFSIKILLKVSL